MKPKTHERPRAATWLLGLEPVLDYITVFTHLSRNAIMITFDEMLLDCIYYR